MYAPEHKVTSDQISMRRWLIVIIILSLSTHLLIIVWWSHIPCVHQDSITLESHDEPLMMVELPPKQSTSTASAPQQQEETKEPEPPAEQPWGSMIGGGIGNGVGTSATQTSEEVSQPTTPPQPEAPSKTMCHEQIEETPSPEELTAVPLTPVHIVPERIASSQSTSTEKPFKKTLSMQELVRGFVKSPQTESKPNGSAGAIGMTGSHNGVVTAAQLDYRSYTEKIGRCLQTSFRINRPSLNSILGRQQAPHTIDIMMSLNKNGSIKQLILAHSSGMPALDEFAMMVFKEAEGSFPPLPDTISEHAVCYHDVFTIFNCPLSSFMLTQKPY